MTPIYMKAAIVLTLLSAIGVQTLRLDHAKLDLAEVQKAWSADRQQAAEASQKAEAAARATEQLWIKQQKERDDANELRLQSIRADAVIAGAAADRLRQRLAAIASVPSQAPADSHAVASGEATTDYTPVLANMLTQCGQHLRAMAQIADTSRAAGNACVAQYEGLTAP
jgi:hypothetical protein